MSSRALLSMRWPLRIVEEVRKKFVDALATALLMEVAMLSVLCFVPFRMFIRVIVWRVCVCLFYDVELF
jgi:hypothetical protein